ncbi:hypothetical protein AVEN_59447-1, partial [Araneus ventricosus]
PNMTNWEKFHLQISKYYLFPENSKVVDDLMHDLATQKIIGVEQLPGGTQLKLILTMEDGVKALFKPMRLNATELYRRFPECVESSVKSGLEPATHPKDKTLPSGLVLWFLQNELESHS